MISNVAQHVQPKQEVCNSAADAQSIRLEFLELAIAMSERADVPSAWPFIARNDNVRQFCCSRDELSHAVAQKFSLDELRLARLTFGPSDTLKAVTAIEPRRQKFLVARSADNTPVDLVGGRGRLVGAAPPCMLYLDRQSPVRIDNTYVLLVASVDDVLIARAHGFHATTIAGLGSASATQLHAIFSPAVYTRRCLQGGFVLPAWQLAAMVNKPPPEVLEVVHQLLRANERLEIDVEELFCVWQPTPGEFRRISDAAKLRDRAAVRKACHASLIRSTGHPPDWDDLLHALYAETTTSIVEARQTLASVKVDRSNPSSMRALRQAQGLYQSVLRRQLVDGCFAAADAENDPVKRLLFSITGGFAEQLLKRDDLQRAAAECQTSNQQILDTQMWNIDELNEQLKFADIIMRLQRAIRL